MDTSTIISSYMVVQYTAKNMTAVGRHPTATSAGRAPRMVSPHPDPDTSMRLTGTMSVAA